MNQAIEQAIIDHTNKVWEQAHKVGLADERERIIKQLQNGDHLIVFDTGIKKNQNRLIHSPKCGLCQSIKLIKGEK